MKTSKTSLIAAAAITVAFTGEAFATDWNVSLWGKRRAFTEHVEKLAELVSEKTNGEFTLTISYGGLSKNTENLDGIEIGAFEMAQFCAGYHPDKNRVITVLELPFMGVSTTEEEVAVSKAIYSHPAAVEEMAQWNARLLMPSPQPQYNLVGKGDEPKTLDDFKGMRVRATGGIGEAFKAIGAVPTSVTATEAYQAMDSGVVDTVAFAPHAHLSFGTINEADWWTSNLNPGTVNCPVVVGIDAYESLSDEEREALDSSVDESIQHFLTSYDELMGTWDSLLAERNVKIDELSDDVIDEFRTLAADPAREAWIASMEDQGIPGQELYDLVQSTLAEAKEAGQ